MYYTLRGGFTNFEWEGTCRAPNARVSRRRRGRGVGVWGGGCSPPNSGWDLPRGTVPLPRNFFKYSTSEWCILLLAFWHMIRHLTRPVEMNEWMNEFVFAPSYGDLSLLLFPQPFPLRGHYPSKPAKGPWAPQVGPATKRISLLSKWLSSKRQSFRTTYCF